MDLTNEDVADILAVLDSLPYDELDLRTSRFRLTLRRAAGGGWSQDLPEGVEPPYVPGMDLAGVVDEAGPDVSREWRRDDRVMAAVPHIPTVRRSRRGYQGSGPEASK